ncbi:M6 family metalloprotease-like protein [Clostridium acetobutylicum]|uniref:Predicted secreted metalloprotease n=1 Tax=Clostridium acetobutylicum (strain ATCC 824 / DSM 792 / JCM 1419 / IAM 19013 / LMG 5710 / NBRC 13948 / NRRL B-527 / VKM B-1787 / 2291 / W) TaxID=272562 RepID=Q97TN3_CLOAB|nr:MULTISPECIES: M6 family metalloprotease domain-containing protein [Clostridium]AAK76811.1 Predicted secreted metalloprotease [Clostridium acetobutylicum ATCC 824]ADZ22847.1 secreted metalloprotease [Clostridium acetobutylicum EA 2018]AEI34807.1 secreted metalloprotease [Clostridium acetobutylicum DSM 1731]AWV82356.1 M6 family metalloprotease domain-containing protein [Clostridium acetobutylicum]MBC2395801.1 M6 family metalloprotease domain-containing protein [Clostridium acetobutylicum]
MAKIIKHLINTTIAAAIVLTIGTGVHAAPIYNQKHELVQPDGSKVEVKITGDEYYQQIESMDGYTLCRDKNGWICYAQLNGDKTDYISTGAVYKDNTLNDMKLSIKSDNTAGIKNKLQKHLEIKKDAIEKKADAVRQKLHAMDYSPKEIKKNSNNINGLLESKVKASNISNVNGLAVLVDFPDKKSDIPKADIENFFNGVNYTGYGNNGSIRDFYYDVSGGKLTYTNSVIGFYTAKHPKFYYDDINETTGSYAKADELADEVFDWLKASGFDASKITTDSNGYAKAVNILYAGTADAGWAKGLWPHQAWYGGSDSMNGVKIQKYEMSDIENDLSIYTICHESGHMIYGYPDLYDYDGDSEGTGGYSLMSGSSDYKNPVPPDPYCRNVISGWNAPISMNSYGSGTKFDAVANANGNQYSYRWSSSNPKEYYLVENIEKTGRYAGVPDSGLAVWHVDEAGDNSKNNMTSNSHYLVSLEQADGRFDLEKNVNGGDTGDLFRAGYRDAFGDNTFPNSKWWNGTASGLNISQISGLGSDMTFVQSGLVINNPYTNIAGQATASTSYVSDWESISALNDGKDPTSSNDRSGAVYGNWPKTGSQWIEYQFNKPFTISSCDVYWFKDGQGIDVPASYTILYWDGSAWQYVKNPKGLGTAINKYNTTTFTPVTTNAIAIQMESNGNYSTGILEWKVFGK